MNFDSNYNPRPSLLYVSDLPGPLRKLLCYNQETSDKINLWILILQVLELLCEQ